MTATASLLMFVTCVFPLLIFASLARVFLFHYFKASAFCFIDFLYCFPVFSTADFYSSLFLFLLLFVLGLVCSSFSSFWR